MRSLKDAEGRLDGSVKGAHQEIQLRGWVWGKRGVSFLVVIADLGRAGDRDWYVGLECVPKVGERLGGLFVTLSPSVADCVFGCGAVQQWARSVAEMEQDPNLGTGRGMGNVNAFIARQLQGGSELGLARGHVGIKQHPDMVVA